MSIQFGKCNFDGGPVDPGDFDQVRPVLAPYGPDGEGYLCTDNFGILYRGFCTTEESHREVQPYMSGGDFILTWDGRLDNRKELIGLLACETTSTDLEIVVAAYNRWRTGCFAKLIGDWAVSIWNRKTQSLVLAKDFIGTRHLYYSRDKDQVSWCTILDPLVLFTNNSHKLEEEYIAGCLSLLPASHLTPYVGVHSVPPSCVLQLTSRGQELTRYWDFKSQEIRYRKDSEYEEHFRTVFEASVRRRLRSDSPILAELSGGMDSSAIVCVADEILSSHLEAPRLDTLSYYDDTEPNWDERPYFAKVEEKRGRVGFHINLGSPQFRVFPIPSGPPSLTPDLSFPAAQSSRRLLGCMQPRANRVLLSGIGGDEVTGGVPTPLPEIDDLLARFRLPDLVKQLKAWALNQRRPWFHVLFESGGRFLPPQVAGLPKHMLPADWIQRDFARKHFPALTGYLSRTRFFGPLPSFQENISTLEALRRQLAYCDFSRTCSEKRYPYLDRDLLEFLFAIPREQVVRPGQRRSLMRRALKGIVPDEILNRRRKAFVARSPMTDIRVQSSLLTEMASHMVSESMGVVRAESFLKAVQQVCRGEEVAIVPLMRTISIEFWLKKLRDHQCLSPHSLEVSFSSRANGAIHRDQQARKESASWLCT